MGLPEIIRDGEAFLLHLQVREHEEEPFLLVLDGNTGAFHGAVQVRYGDHNATEYLHVQVRPEHLQSNRYYGHYQDAAWALDLRTLQFAYRSSPGLKLVDARDQVEDLLGRLP